MKFFRILNIVVSCIVIAMTIEGCTPDWTDTMEPGYKGSAGNTTRPDRVENEHTNKVMLLYIAGYNNLKEYLEGNINSLGEGWLPSHNHVDDILLVYSHLSKTRFDFNTPTEPVLIRMYADNSGEPVADTIRTFSSSAISASAGQLNEVLTFIKDEFPARSYGMIFSSHGSGYLPSGFYADPDNYMYTEEASFSQGKRAFRPVSVPYIEVERDPTLPEVKSIGQSVHGRRSYEIDLKEFADAIPMKLDYILFDACLMGGIEVAYELADKCDRIGFSQAEVLADGFNYTTITSHLLNNSTESYPERVCKDYFEQYNAKTGAYRSATISIVDCNKIQPVAEICNDLFEKYRNGLKLISPSKVQKFYTSNHHWFYDLESIMENAGANKEDMDNLRSSIDGCMIYKAATPSFLELFQIKTFCGLSMYLPCNGNSELDKYYKTLGWNQATGLIQ